MAPTSASCPLLVLLGLVASAAVAFAAPFSYNESTQGDLNDFAFGTFVGNADTGLNSVTGTINSNDTGDRAAFTIPAGFEVISIQLTVTNFSGSGTARARLFSGSNGDTLLALQDFQSNGVYTFVPVPAAPLPTGAYVMEANDLTIAPSYDYTWSVIAAPVPEPGTLGLLGIGSVIAAISLRKQK